MALAIDKREREGIMILTLVGDLIMGPEDVAFRTAIQHCIAAGKIKIILDCSRLGNIDSTGLDTLFLLDVGLRQAGGRVILLNIARTGMELLVLARLNAAFELFTDEHEAVNSFFPNRALNPWDVLEFVEKQGRQDGWVPKGTHGPPPYRGRQDI